MFLQLMTVCILFLGYDSIVSLVTRPWARWFGLKILVRARDHLFGKVHRHCLWGAFSWYWGFFPWG